MNVRSVNENPSTQLKEENNETRTEIHDPDSVNGVETKTRIHVNVTKLDDETELDDKAMSGFDGNGTIQSSFEGKIEKNLNETSTKRYDTKFGEETKNDTEQYIDDEDPGWSEFGDYMTDEVDIDYNYKDYTTDIDYSDYTYYTDTVDTNTSHSQIPFVYTDRIWYRGTDLSDDPFSLSEIEKVELSSPNKWHQFGDEREAEWLTEDNHRKPHAVLSSITEQEGGPEL